MKKKIIIIILVVIVIAVGIVLLCCNGKRKSQQPQNGATTAVSAETVTDTGSSQQAGEGNNGPGNDGESTITPEETDTSFEPLEIGGEYTVEYEEENLEGAYN